MSVRANYTWKPRASGRDLRQSSVLFAAILVFVVVAMVLYFGIGRRIDPSISSSDSFPKTNVQSVVPALPTLDLTPASQASVQTAALAPKRDSLTNVTWTHLQPTVQQ